MFAGIAEDHSHRCQPASAARGKGDRCEAGWHIEDPWLAPLQRVRGKVEFDGLERVSSQSLLDMLEVPSVTAQRARTGVWRS
jgi:hypothetical protein